MPPHNDGAIAATGDANMGMRRRGRRLVTWASTVATGLAALAWSISYADPCGICFTCERFRDEGSGCWSSDVRSATVPSRSGRLCMYIGEIELDWATGRSRTPPHGVRVKVGRAEYDPYGDRAPWLWYSWNYWRYSIGGLGMQRLWRGPGCVRQTCITIPYYMLATVAVTPLVLSRVSKPGHMWVATRCFHCSYPVLGLPAGSPCPECGMRAGSGS